MYVCVYVCTCRFDLIGSVQQLLCGVSSEIDLATASAGEMEEFLVNLETTDNKFNRYDTAVDSEYGLHVVMDHFI